MNTKIKIFVGILVIGVILISGWFIFYIQETQETKELCTAINLVNCDGKRVKIVGIFDGTKGCMGIIDVDIKERHREFGTSANLPPHGTESVLLPEFANKCEEALKYLGKRVEVIGIIHKPVPYDPTLVYQYFGGMWLKPIESICILQEVTVKTNKRKYKQGEAVKITVSNGFSERIWIPPTDTLDFYLNLADIQELNIVDLSLSKELKPGERHEYIWDQKITDKLAPEKGTKNQASADVYRINFRYSLDARYTKTKITSSNNFIIKEK
ncbi:MAG: hypothetical protein AB1567_09125 [bacterium]